METVDMVDNILAVYGEATDEDLAAGREWYNVAHTYAVGLSHQYYGVTVEQAAGVIAALSPRLPWDRNMAYAERLIRTGDTPVLNGNKDKARRILRGEAPLDVLGGRKVRAFYATILDRYTQEVVIDRHAFDVAYGEVTDEHTRKMLDRVGMYDRFSDAYRRAAYLSGVSVSVLQATTWVTWRRLKGIAD